MYSYVSTKREYLIKYLKKIKKLYEEPIIFKNKIIGKKMYCKDNDINIEVECYYNLNNLCVIRTNNKAYIPDKGLVKVSALYEQENILQGLIKVPNYTLEGTDGIGKSTTIELLIEEGIVCFDRNLNVICKYMLFNVPLETRIDEYKKFLKSTKDKIIFLVNMDEEELRRRINSRDIVSEFDKYSVEYNRMYFTTYKELERQGFLYDHLFLADCTGLSITEQKDKIKRMILR